LTEDRTAAATLLVGEPTVLGAGARVEILEAEPAPGGGFEPAPSPRATEAALAEAGLLKARTIEFGASHEEAVVSKEAVVREELVVKRETSEHVEKIDETVRSMDAEVERLAPSADRDARGADQD
jgi:hypothetical protein